METIVACTVYIIYGPRLVKEIVSAQNLPRQWTPEQESVKRYSAVISISRFHPLHWFNNPFILCDGWLTFAPVFWVPCGIVMVKILIICVTAKQKQKGIRYLLRTIQVKECTGRPKRLSSSLNTNALPQIKRYTVNKIITWFCGNKLTRSVLPALFTNQGQMV